MRTTQIVDGYVCVVIGEKGVGGGYHKHNNIMVLAKRQTRKIESALDRVGRRHRSENWMG